MLAASLIAFGHFISLFALIAALVLQLALVSDSMSVEIARRVQRADRIYGLAAMSILTFGFLRVVYFEKGSAYYFSNTFFLVKLGLFIVVGLISIYPTILYSRWSKDLKQEIAPGISEGVVKRLRRIIHWELVLLGGILLCASLMAKGFGS
jgi:putative membrane protein